MLYFVMNQLQVTDIGGDGPEVRDVKQRLDAGRRLFSGRNEVKRCERFPALAACCDEVSRTLEASTPPSVLRFDGRVIYDFTDQAELLQRWLDAHAVVQRALDDALPPLPVKPGDWTKLGGRLMQVQSVNLRRRIAHVVYSRPDGSGGDSVKADSLAPTTPDDPTAEPWPECPPHITDAHSRARFYLHSLEQLIEREGLEPDPFERVE